MNSHIKRIGIVLLFFVLFSTLSVCVNTIPEVTISSIEIDQTSIEEHYDIDQFDLGSLQIKVLFSDETYEVLPITEAMLSSEQQALLSRVGEHQITNTYQKNNNQS